MKKIFKTILFFVFLGVVLYATNPSQAEFVEYASKEMTKDLEKQESGLGNSIDGLLNSLADSFSSSAVKEFSKRKNYYLFSVYEIDFFDMKASYIGVFRIFIPVESIETAIDELKAQFD